jgi:hypothetical protein
MANTLVICLANIALNKKILLHSLKDCLELISQPHILQSIKSLVADTDDLKDKACWDDPGLAESLIPGG